MPEITLIIELRDGATCEVSMSGDRLMIGRGTDDKANAGRLEIDDAGIAHRHASINREGDRVWILDEGSSTGTFLNGRQVPPIGEPLFDGNEIQLGNHTTIRCAIGSDAKTAEPLPAANTAPPIDVARTPLVLPLALAVVSILIIAALGSYALSRRSAEQPATVGGSTSPNTLTFDSAQASTTIAPTPLPTADPTSTPMPPDATAVTPTIDVGASALAEDASDLTSYTGKRYLQMTPEEQMDFIERRAQHISMMMGNRPYVFNDEVLRYIKQYVDVYARRVGNGSTRMWGEDLRTMFARARANYSPHIIRAFNRRGVPPVVGLYLVVVETEYHNIQSENFAGAAGLFQFIGPTAEAYGVPRSERTNIEKMAPAAAHYLADRIAEFGPDSMSVALAIAGYNRNPDSVRRDLRDVLNSENKERSFWTLVANSDKLDRYFQNENIKYVPKFFAAAIVGETPEAFGLQMRKLSTYTNVETARTATPNALTQTPNVASAAP